MFYYDEDGDVQMTTDPDTRRRNHVRTMLETNRYGLRPAAAGKLREALGDVNPRDSAEQARKRIRRALQEIGFEGTDFSVAVEALDQSWQQKIQIGE